MARATRTRAVPLARDSGKNLSEQCEHFPRRELAQRSLSVAGYYSYLHTLKMRPLVLLHVSKLSLLEFLISTN